MRKPRAPRTSTVEGLRLAIDCLPVATREAMLTAVSSDARIIAGAYVDEHGGVCPMLAAHRSGGRTDFLSFARSWDRFTRARTGARVVTARERRILLAHLQASLVDVDGLDLDRAIAEHRRLRSERLRRGRVFLGGAEPTGEILVQRLRAGARRLQRLARA
jgi:hypothetical protein